MPLGMRGAPCCTGRRWAVVWMGRQREASRCARTDKARACLPARMQVQVAGGLLPKPHSRTLGLAAAMAARRVLITAVYLSM